LNKENKKMGRPKDYDTTEERKIRSIRLTETQVSEIKKKYKTVQDFVEDAYEIITGKSS
jgi:hypothetical protein